MPTDDQILDDLRQAFASSKRPDHFTNYTHCEECAGHDATLLSRNLETLRLSDIGNEGWDPICFISQEGFVYYFPALARIALSVPAKPIKRNDHWYCPQLLFHLRTDITDRRKRCTPDQRKSVVRFLEHIVETRAELVDHHRCADALLDAIALWTDEESERLL